LLWNWGRLRPINFPREWRAADRLLVQNGGGRMLFLPWHLYISLSFTGYRVANPAPSFFSVPVLSGDNVEVNGIETQSLDPDSKLVESVLADASTRARAAQIFASMCIRWVVLAKEFDYASYDWLMRIQGLEEVRDNGRLTIWRDMLTPQGCRW
jgi:hypothetical protein